MKEVRPPKRPLIFYYCVAMLILLLFNFLAMPWMARQQIQEVDYGTFMDMAENQDLGQVEIQEQENQIVFTNKDETAVYSTGMIPDPDLKQMLKDSGAEFSGQVIQQTDPILSFLLTWILPIVIFVALGQYLSRRMMKNMGGPNAMAFGKSNAKVYVKSSEGIKFSDVAGEDEAKDNLKEIVEYLHDPKKYQEIGATMPKGILLVGPPGTGKTMLAKAVAGEANVPFFSISGSDFVEMFVGMGASKVRDLFKQAKEKAPCIVFIDEIDAIGQKRNSGAYGGNDEREQTLNQLLTEMDGFEGNTGVIILAATNRPESLDPALLRPGRFDRRIPVELPDLQGRIEILKVHAKKIRLAEDVNFEPIAKTAAGASGAELANIVNEAALRAVRSGRQFATQEDLQESVEVVIAGYQKKSRVLSDQEKKIVAYHETGHALVAALQSHSAPVQKITIVPHTQGSLGYTLLMPEEDKTELRTRDELMAKIMVSMGGRAAEEVVMNTMTNGASQDIQDATNVARNMVAMFGMSDEFGMMALASRRNQYLDGGYGMDCAQDTAARMDQAVKDILDQCYQQAVEVIKASREDMDKVVAYLLEKETITGAEMVAIIEGRDPELVENPYASTRAEDKAFRPSSPETIEAPAKKVHMISQKIESPEEPAQEGQPENPVSDPSPSGGDAPQESGSTPSEPPKDTP